MMKLMVDMGILRVEVIGAKNLMAGDRSGKSDVSPPLPYCDRRKADDSLMSVSTLMELGYSNRRLRRSKRFRVIALQPNTQDSQSDLEREFRSDDPIASICEVQFRSSRLEHRGIIDRPRRRSNRFGQSGTVRSSRNDYSDRSFREGREGKLGR